MGLRSPKKSALSSSNRDYNDQAILNEWIIAISQFRESYTKLISCINDLPNAAEPLKKNGIGVNQSSVDQMVSLSITMKNELEKLYEDLDKPDSDDQQMERNNFEKLARHVVVLNDLTHQARIKLTLASFSAL